MHKAVQTLIEKVSSWDAVTAQPHRFGGVEFSLGNVEIGHVHNSGMVDIPFTRKLREALVDDHQAEPHHLLADSGWITFYIRCPEDADQALRLFRLSYVHKGSRRRRDLDVTAELAALGFGSAVDAQFRKRETGSL